ncbi:MAG: ExbD/TolR family protein [Thermoanaerobaculia bacterium]
MGFRIDNDDFGDLSEINVTPLVDVMLVLLIIFMVTAPMLTQGLSVSLPEAEGRALEQATSNPSKVSILANGAVYVDGIALGSGDVEATLGSFLRSRRVTKALLEADETVPYGRVIQVMDVMNHAGVEQLGMVTQPGKRKDARRGR